MYHAQWTVAPQFDRWTWTGIHALRKPIVVTIHDVIPHERHDVDRAHAIWMAEHADAVIVHGDALRNSLLSISAADPANVHVLPHGNFTFVADDFAQASPAAARASLSLGADDVVILFFGFIRPYKGLDELLEALALLRQDASGRFGHVRLLVVGRALPSSGEPARLRQLIDDLDISGAVTWIDEYVDLSEVGRFFLAADLVVPYRSGSQSGVLQLAYAFDRPAIVTRVGSIEEVALDERTALVVEPNDRCRAD